MALASFEASNSRDLQREAVRGLFIKKDLLNPLDAQKKNLKDHGDYSVALDFATIKQGEKSLFVEALRWDLEPYRKDIDTKMWRSKAVRVTHDPETDETTVSYVAETESSDGKKKNEWRTIGSNEPLDKRIEEAVKLANGKTFDERTVKTGTHPSGFPGIGRNFF